MAVVGTIRAYDSAPATTLHGGRAYAGEMPNMLADAISPYLRSHADNPVAWQQWGSEAFAEAERRDVPLLVSIGYSTCHWCHVQLPRVND
jgi:hypothetical protein